MTPFLRDVWAGWRARPEASAALAVLGLVVGTLGALGMSAWSEADRERTALLERWPRDRTTLIPPGNLSYTEHLRLQSRLPEGEWLGWREEGSITWIFGTLPPGFFTGRGHPPSPKRIAEGFPAALVIPETGWRTGQTASRNDFAFLVRGVGAFPLPGEILLPAGVRGVGEVFPQRIEVRRPADEVTRRVRSLPFADAVRILDHGREREIASRGFRRLGLRLGLMATATALLTALMVQALVRFAVRERRIEFALRRSLGARPADILHQILLETLFTAGVPSALGVLALWNSLPVAGAGLPVVLPGWFVLCALPPALRAARLPPHEALKEA